ncbi:MAG: hypothetical protein NVS3B14_09440 [Ktedonobacteraceae bacterium]
MMNTINTRKDMEHSQITSQETSTWVREVLEPGQLSTAKRVQRARRRQLSPETVIILWVLRLYVVVMMLIIAYQIWTVIQS